MDRQDAATKKREAAYAMNCEKSKRARETKGGVESLMGAAHSISRNIDFLYNDKDLGGEGRSCRGVFDVEERHIENRKKAMDSNSGFTTGCDPKAFKAVVSRISNEKVFEIQELGFGPVHQFRCRELNFALCKMLLENFNVDRCTIKIHGRNLTITEKDFGRLLGLRCHGTEVTLPKRFNLDHEIAELQGIIWGVDKEMTVDRLRRNVVFTDDPDDLFMVSFVLFSLCIMFCPTRPGYVDPRLLLLVKDRKCMRRYNWGRFAFYKLLEEVKLYQSNQPEHVGGCLVFLQLFYLTVIGERMFVIPKSVPPVMTWGRKESNRVYEIIEAKGGFNATNGIWVTKRFSGIRSTEFSGSRDYSTGLKTNLKGDMLAMRSLISSAEEKVGVLETSVHRIGPDISNLLDAVTLLHDSLLKLKGRDVSGLVDDVCRAVKSIEYGDVHLTGVSGSDENKCRREDVNAYIVKLVGPYSDPKGPGSFSGSGEVRKHSQRKFGTVAKLSPLDLNILKFLSSQKARAEDSLGSFEVARFGEFSVSRWDLQCLSPTCTINSKVINIVGEYCFVNRDDWWFLPTLFSDRAKDYYDSYAGMQSYVSAIVTMCRLHKFNGRLKACRKIFIPILDDVLDHWFLAVSNITEYECEIWDSIPDLLAQQRRKNLLNNVMTLLGEVFSSELQHSDLGPSAFSSYSVTYPESMRSIPDKYDSGIFTIRHLQYYRERWFSVFNSGDERVRIALEIVKNPMNECYNIVLDSMYREDNEIRECEEVPATTGDIVDVKADLVISSMGMKLKPRVPRRS